MKKTLVWLLKAAVAAVLAVALLSGFCYFYYNPPIRVSNSSGATDYVWEKGKFYSLFTEGFAWGKSDENGYNNVEPQKDVDILLMGSSQMEGHNVSQKQNACYLLNKKMNDSSMNMYIYNIGISGHELVNNVSNMENALKTFSPKKYIVFQLGTCVLNKDDMNSVVRGDFWHYSIYDSGLLYYAQKIPFFRAIYKQLKNTNPLQAQDVEEVSAPKNEAEADAEYSQSAGDFFKYIKEVSDKYGVQPIILYHASLEIKSDGKIETQRDTHAEWYSVLKSKCEENGIVLLDVTDRFINEYYENDTVPYGFSNTKIGTGHLNKFGHELIADELFEFLKDGEGAVS